MQMGHEAMPVFIWKLLKFRDLVFATLLLDMRTRFGRSYLGYLIAIAWPLSHLGALTAVYLLRTTVAPVGDSPTIFAATGLVPYILCLYPGRILATTMQQNRHLLSIPIIKPIHMIVSRCILETLNSLVVLFIFCFVIYLFDVEIIPDDVVVAGTAIAAAIYLGLGLGVFNVVMCALAGPMFIVVFVLILAALYITSGVYVPIDYFPDSMREILQYNPLLNIVEWLRAAYYGSYDIDKVNKLWVVLVASTALMLGLLGERVFRGKFLSA